MHDGSTILKLQQQKEVRYLQDIKSRLYDDANSFRIAYAACCFIIPVAITLLQIIDSNSITEEFCFALSIIFYAVCFICSKQSEERRKTAASIQQIIDGMLYGITFFHDEMNIDLAAKAARKIDPKKTDLDSNKPWYSTQIEGMDANEAAIACQEENMTWSKGLLKRWKIELIASFLILTAFIFISATRYDVKIATLSFVFAPIQYCFEKIYEINRSLNLIDGFDTILGINSESLNSRAKVEKQQAIIYQLRRSTPLPSLLYKLFRNTDESAAKERIELAKLINRYDSNTS